MGGFSPPANCALQAETSKKAFELMQRHGFNDTERENAKARSEVVENNYPSSPSEYYMDTFMHTGKHWINGTKGQRTSYDHTTGSYTKTTCSGQADVKTGFWSWDPAQYIEG